MTKRTITIEEDRYKVEIDEYNHTLYKYDVGGYEVKTPKTGEIKIKEPSWTFVGYFPNMLQCLTKSVELDMLEGVDTGIQTYLDELKTTIKELNGRMTK